MKKMKKMKMIIGCVALITFSCKAQIIPVEEDINYRNSETEFPEGAYIKDVNNLLDKYVGTWIGAYDNKTFEFRIIEYIDEDYSFISKKDKLLLRYKITNSNGSVIEDTTTLPNESPYVIKGNYLSNTSSFYVLSYIGKEADCGQHGEIFIDVQKNPNIMKASLEVIGDLINASDCPNGEAEQILPTEQFTLIKQ